MCEALYAEVDLIETVLYLVKQEHHSDISVAILGRTHPSNTPNRMITIRRTGVTKRHSLGRLQSQLFPGSVI